MLAAVDAQPLVDQVRGALCLVVTTPAGRYRRRIFLTVGAAEKAAERATDAGHVAEIVLCRLDPIWIVSGVAR